MKKIDYNNKIAIVTGATSGIGYEITKTLIRKYKCKVYGVARSVKKLEVMREELGPEYFMCSCMDVTDEKSWEKLAQYFKTVNEQPDILINCAGILPKFSSVAGTDSKNIEDAMNVNFMSCVYSCKSMLQIMAKGGAVINVSSASALCPFAGVSAYSASKAALERFTEALSCESKDVSVSCVMPGFVKTEIMKDHGVNDEEKRIISSFSADPERVAHKIIKRAGKRKKRIVIGKDAHFMSMMYRLFPGSAPSFFSRIIKKSGLELFKEV